MFLQTFWQFLLTSWTQAVPFGTAIATAWCDLFAFWGCELRHGASALYRARVVRHGPWDTWPVCQINLRVVMKLNVLKGDLASDHFFGGRLHAKLSGYVFVIFCVYIFGILNMALMSGHPLLVAKYLGPDTSIHGAIEHWVDVVKERLRTRWNKSLNCLTWRVWHVVWHVTCTTWLCHLFGLPEFPGRSVAADASTLCHAWGVSSAQDFAGTLTVHPIATESMGFLSRKCDWVYFPRT